MPYCGEVGCPCSTCQRCGTYDDCVCNLLKSTRDAIARYRRETDLVDVHELIHMLDEWQSKYV